MGCGGAQLRLEQGGDGAKLERSDEYAICSDRCDFDQDCPAPADGTAVQACDDNGLCVLLCGQGLACPTGMSCVEDIFEGSFVCAWN